MIIPFRTMGPIWARSWAFVMEYPYHAVHMDICLWSGLAKTGME